MKIGGVLQNLEGGSDDGERNQYYHRAHRRSTKDMRSLSEVGFALFDKRELRSMPYDEYLKSGHWNEVRKHVLSSRSRRCCVCGEIGHDENRLQVHHLTYAHRGDEMNHLEDLVILCQTCHGRQHFGDGKVNAIVLEQRKEARESSVRRPA